MSADDVARADGVRAALLQGASAGKSVVVKRGPVNFTGDIAKDFASQQILTYQKGPDTAATTALAYDDTHLYIGWCVRDQSPWINGADAPPYLYARGDTVDLQLGDQPKSEMRLSIGNFKGKPVAVLYRPVIAEKQPMTFSSGVVKEYKVDYVADVPTVEIKVFPRGNEYTVEVKVPLAAFGLSNLQGRALRGDVGVTYGDATGMDTSLRSHWSNQQTGLVSDEVYELQMEPKNWGEFTFQ